MAGSPPPSGDQIELRQGEQLAVVVEVGGGLRLYRDGERDLIDGYGEGAMCSGARGQALMPWPNRLRDGRYEFAGRELQLPLSEPSTRTAIHGLVRWVNWSVAEQTASSVRMHYRLHPQPGYPFTLDLLLAYELGAEGLSVTMSATNLGAEACPFGAGAHPYLRAGTEIIDDCWLQAPGARRLRSDERSLPVGLEHVDGSEYDFRAGRELGPTQLDTGFTELERDPDGMARVRLRGPDGHRVTLWQDAGFPYLMLFTGETLPEPERRRGLAAEPMTCPPDAFRSGDGLRVLQPGETFSGAWGITSGAL